MAFAPTGSDSENRQARGRCETVGLVLPRRLLAATSGTARQWFAARLRVYPANIHPRPSLRYLPLNRMARRARRSRTHAVRCGRYADLSARRSSPGTAPSASPCVHCRSTPSWSCATPGSGSPPRNCRTCSNGSTGCGRPGRTREGVGIGLALVEDAFGEVWLACQDDLRHPQRQVGQRRVRLQEEVVDLRGNRHARILPRQPHLRWPQRLRQGSGRLLSRHVWRLLAGRLRWLKELRGIG